MADLKHITLTGIDDKTDIKELVRLQKQYPLVEFGVLLSWSRQGSERRYPSFQTIKAFNEAGLRLSAHVCGSAARQFAQGETDLLDYLFDQIGTVRFHRMQLNLAGFPAEKFVPLPTEYGCIKEIILQRLDADEFDLLRERLGDHPSVLLDASGGRGRETPIVPLKGPFKVGYAGGFGPDNVDGKLTFLLDRPEIGEFWIDMESGVRSFDWFDTAKAEAVLKKCYAVLLRNNIYPVFDTHNTFCEGGRKMHLMNWETGRCLCGYKPGFFNEVNLDHPESPYKSTLEYVSQPDPDRNLCLRCKEIFVNRMQRYAL